MIKFILFRIYKFLKMEQYINISEKTSTSGNIILIQIILLLFIFWGMPAKSDVTKATNDNFSTIIPHP